MDDLRFESWEDMDVDRPNQIHEQRKARYRAVERSLAQALAELREVEREVYRRVRQKTEAGTALPPPLTGCLTEKPMPRRDTNTVRHSSIMLITLRGRCRLGNPGRR
jgi:hypothetical protein